LVPEYGFVLIRIPVSTYSGGKEFPKLQILFNNQVHFDLSNLVKKPEKAIHGYFLEVCQEI